MATTEISTAYLVKFFIQDQIEQVVNEQEVFLKISEVLGAFSIWHYENFHTIDRPNKADLLEELTKHLGKLFKMGNSTVWRGYRLLPDFRPAIGHQEATDGAVITTYFTSSGVYTDQDIFEPHKKFVGVGIGSQTASGPGSRITNFF
jgi:hypothetical protein